MRPNVLHPTARRFRPMRYFAEILAALIVLTALAALTPARAAEVASGVLDQAMDKVLVVRSADDEDRFLGSAFLWGTMAEVAVTNAHVVGNAAEVRLVDRAGRERVAVVIARDAVRDVAVIGLPEGFLGREGFVPGTTPGLGTPVWAMGAPFGIAFSLTKGLISADPRQVEVAVPIRLVQHDAAVNPGSSGGPLVDAMGQLVGMNSRIADGSRMFVGIAYAITADDLLRLVPLLIAEELPAFPKLGLRARAVDRQVAAALGVGLGGLLVDGVETSGLAERAGLQGGDLILAVNGVVIEGAGHLAFLIEEHLAQGSVDLAILRMGHAVLVTLDLGPADSAGGLLLRAASGSAAQRTASYRLESLGLELADGGRIDKILDNSPAIWSGLAQGDRILAVNGETYDLRGLRGLEITAPVLVLVQGRDGHTRHVLVDPWGKSIGLRPVGGANVLDPAVVVF